MPVKTSESGWPYGPLTRPAHLLWPHAPPVLRLCRLVTWPRFNLGCSLQRTLQASPGKAPEGLRAEGLPSERPAPELLCRQREGGLKQERPQLTGRQAGLEACSNLEGRPPVA